MLTTGVDSAGLQSAGDALRVQAENMRESLRLLEVAFSRVCRPSSCWQHA